MRREPFFHRKSSSPARLEPERSISLLRESLAKGRGTDATALFERLNATHWIPRRPNLVPWLQREIGTHPTSLLIDAFARLPCHFCRGEWAPCETCGGRGCDQRGRACKTCSGLGLSCCAACAGAGLVNYAAVPIGLRHAVLKARVADAAKRIRSLRTSSGRHSLDRVEDRLRIAMAARGMLANALRAGAERTPDYQKIRDAIPAVTAKRVRNMTQRLVTEVDSALRVTIAEMAALEQGATDRIGQGAGTDRAEHLRQLAGRKVFVSPLLFQRVLGSL